MKLKLKNSKGAVLLISAAFIPVLMAIAALMVDVGIAFSAKNRIEYVAIQAVEAAENRLPDAAAAESMAETLATSMLSSILSYSHSPVVTASSDGSTVSVQIVVQTKAYFAPVIGINSLSVRAAASRPLP